VNFRRQQTQAVRAEVDERLRRLAAGWAPTPAVPIELQAPSEPVAPLRADHWGRRSWRAFVLLLTAVAVVAGWLWWQGQPRGVTAIPGAGAPTSGTPVVSGEVIVHVAGAVVHPGLVRLPAGARVADAIDKAGGPKSPRYLDSVNLARVLVDGEQIVLGTEATGSKAAGKLSLGAATAAELEQLPGVGPVLAQRIVSWRTDHGPFRAVDDLNDVSGVGDALMEQLRPLVAP
jgi:competence protein ComEA